MVMRMKKWICKIFGHDEIELGNDFIDPATGDVGIMPFRRFRCRRCYITREEKI